MKKLTIHPIFIEDITCTVLMLVVMENTKT